MAIACVQAHTSEMAVLPVMTAPSLRKSAALTIRPAASRGSEVLAVNLKRKSKMSSYHSREVKCCHLLRGFCFVVVVVVVGWFCMLSAPVCSALLYLPIRLIVQTPVCSAVHARKTA